VRGISIKPRCSWNSAFFGGKMAIGKELLLPKKTNNKHTQLTSLIDGYLGG